MSGRATQHPNHGSITQPLVCAVCCGDVACAVICGKDMACGVVCGMWLGCGM